MTPTCSACGLVLGGTSCIDKRVYRWGEEPCWQEPELRALRPVVDCGDCGAPVGGYHHPGCTQATCALCNKQAFGCRHDFGPFILAHD